MHKEAARMLAPFATNLEKLKVALALLDEVYREMDIGGHKLCANLTDEKNDEKLEELIEICRRLHRFLLDLV
ncbi:hypothetical protein [Gelria sp. Kuro-4]|uniref:hypothetical protein n=1 Tax=Gelria sp. Kuro-4 TaxID=2796927 RepID=UPI001BF05DAC|nr:hypothetical protein [Gelria sp. Kuro-4]BCV23278.1 hypothetical protein kuro4_00510 [Gelria sp. Kuro-4]